MSDAFSFMFGFYGLLLGLAVAELAAGFSRAYDERQVRAVGLVAPLFAVLLFLDLVTFWTGAWEDREMPEVEFHIVVGASVIALLYYFAATQVFPRAGNSETLTHHIMHSRRTVVFCVILSNVLSIAPVLPAAVGMPIGDLALWMGLSAVYYALLATAALARSERVVVAALVIAIIFLPAATVVFG